MISKSVTIGAIAVLLGLSASSAAMAQSPSDWTGFYVGIVGGAAVGSSNILANDEDDFRGGGGDGFSASAVAGVNWQGNDNLVLGLEAEISALTLGYHGFHNGYDWDYVAANYSGSISARAGILLTPSSLLYAKGGVGMVNYVLDDWNGTPTIVEGPTAVFTAGFGLDQQISENVILRGEMAFNTTLDPVSADYSGFIYAFEPSFAQLKVGALFAF